MTDQPADAAPDLPSEAEAALLADAPPGASRDPMGDAAAIALLDNEKASLEERLAKIKLERGLVEARLLAYAEENELQRITINGRTVYLREQVWAFRRPDVDDDAYFDAFRADPSWAYLVKDTVLATALSARWREALDGRSVEEAVAAGDVPEAVAAVVREDVRYSIQSLKATPKSTRRSRG